MSKARRETDFSYFLCIFWLSYLAIIFIIVEISALNSYCEPFFGKNDKKRKK